MSSDAIGRMCIAICFATISASFLLEETMQRDTAFFIQESERDAQLNAEHDRIRARLIASGEWHD